MRVRQRPDAAPLTSSLDRPRPEPGRPHSRSACPSSEPGRPQLGTTRCTTGGQLGCTGDDTPVSWGHLVGGEKVRFHPLWCRSQRTRNPASQKERRTTFGGNPRSRAGPGDRTGEGARRGRWRPDRRSGPARTSRCRTRSGVAHGDEGKTARALRRGATRRRSKREGHSRRTARQSSPTRKGAGARPGSAGQGEAGATRKGRADSVWGTGSATRPPASPTCRGPRSMFARAFPTWRQRHAERHLT